LREYVSVMPPSMGMGDWKIALAVDLNDESAHAVRWVVTNYLCPGYPVMILMSDQQVFFRGTVSRERTFGEGRRRKL